MNIKGFLKKTFDAMCGLDVQSMPVYEEMKKEGWKVDFAFPAMPFPLPPIMLVIKPNGEFLGENATAEDRKQFQDSFARAQQRLSQRPNLG